MKATHRITDHGITTEVEQVRPGVGIDASGNEHDLFVRAGRRGYRIQKLGRRKQRGNRDAARDDIRDAEIALGMFKDGV